MNKSIIYYSTLFIYLLTLLVHVVLLNIENGRNYLGLTMVIPLLAVITATIWSVWHLPIAFFYKSYDLWIVGIFSYVTLLFVLSMVLTYTREYGRSVVPAAILHGMFNVFYLTDGLQNEWNIERIELTKFILLAIVFGMMCLIHQKMKR